MCFTIQDTFKYMVMSHAFHNCCECPEDRRTGFEPIIFRFTCNCSTLLCLLYESLTGSVLLPLNYRRIFNCCKCSVLSRWRISTAGIKWTGLSEQVKEYNPVFLQHFLSYSAIFTTGWAHTMVSENLEPIEFRSYRSGWVQTAVLEKMESLRFFWLGTTAS